MNTVITAAGPGRTTALSRWAVPLICVAQLMATLDVTIVNLALPSIDADLDFSEAGLAWVIGDTGIASGLLSTFQAVGGTVGVAFLVAATTAPKAVRRAQR